MFRAWKKLFSPQMNADERRYNTAESTYLIYPQRGHPKSEAKFHFPHLRSTAFILG
jgi:hypothetical protein